METLTIIDRTETLTFQDGNETVIIQQPREVVEFKEQGVLIVQVPIVFVPFHFVATEGQTDFTLPTAPAAILNAMINGIGQSEVRGDFSFTGQVLTFDAGLQEGDEVAGVYAQSV